MDFPQNSFYVVSIDYQVWGPLENENARRKSAGWCVWGLWTLFVIVYKFSVLKKRPIKLHHNKFYSNISKNKICRKKINEHKGPQFMKYRCVIRIRLGGKGSLFKANDGMGELFKNSGRCIREIQKGEIQSWRRRRSRPGEKETLNICWRKKVHIRAKAWIKKKGKLIRKYA